LSGTEASDGGTANPALGAGRVGRPHGLDGSFYVTRPKPRLLADAKLLSVAGEPRKIVRRAGTEQRPILRLEGIDSREAIELLRGADLIVADAEAPSLAADEWWAHELEGCEVFDGTRQVGTVLRMIELPSCEALEVAPPDGGQQLLVPMVTAAIRSIDTESLRVDVDTSYLGLNPQAPAEEGQ
jgi:16S rRNA processing protein RimM